MSAALIHGNVTGDHVRVTVIRDWERLAALEADWRRLHALTPDHTPWQSWDWLQAWWPMQSHGARLQVGVVSACNRVCGILPLQQVRRTLSGVPVDVLEPIGMPDEINRPRIMLGPQDPGSFAVGMDALLNDATTPWDVLRWDEVESGAWDSSQLEALALQRGLRRHAVPLHPCPRLCIDGDWEAYLASRGRKLNRNLRAARRQLARRGALRLQVVDAADELERAYDVFLSVFARSWKHPAGIAFARGDGYDTYYRALLARLGARGAVRILLLWCGQIAVAAAISVLDRGVCYGAQIAHDRSFDHCSPGTLLEALELEYLWREGRCRQYDFFGAALNNKQRWTDHLPMTARVLLFRPTLRGRLLATWQVRLRPLLRNLYGAIR